MVNEQGMAVATETPTVVEVGLINADTEKIIGNILMAVRPFLLMSVRKAGVQFKTIELTAEGIDLIVLEKGVTKKYLANCDQVNKILANLVDKHL